MLCHFCAIFLFELIKNKWHKSKLKHEKLKVKNAKNISKIKENPALQGAGKLAQRVGFENTRKIRNPLRRNGLKIIPFF